MTVTVAVSVGLLGARLGHYALWDDEAGTALNAKSLLRTGDTSAWVDSHNIFAYRNGAELRDLKNRYLPPLSAALTAAAFGLSGRTDALMARLPFALMGLATVVLLFWSIGPSRAGPATYWVLAAAVIGNTSFYLFARQARYYAPALLVTLAISMLYVRHRTARSGVWSMAALSVLLIASNYLNYAALYACLAADYALWGRRERALARRDWLPLLAPQLIAGGVIAAIWNPFRTSAGLSTEFGGLGERMLLIVRLAGGLTRNELACGGLLAIGVLIGIVRRDRWLLRGTAAMGVYLTAVAALSPRLSGHPLSADVRYLAPLIPLGILVAVRTVLALAGRRAWLAAPIALVAFGTNLLHGGPWSPHGLQSTPWEFLAELHRPPTDPYTVTARWIRQRVPSGRSILVLPDYMAYPLMFHAPHPVYAWQLPSPPAPGLNGLPAIHFKGVVAPDYIVTFGPSVELVREWCRHGSSYTLEARLDHYWKDLHRPELTSHRFTPVTRYDPLTESIHVFARR